ncbi:MAG: hypothetical protein OXM01_04000 [Gemmatimonadota bacterium]|nr:hypothetical protein [Gemmatimonadota bacterium]
MKCIFLIGLATLVLGGQPANAQPHIYTIGLVFTDLVDREVLPVHLAEQHPRLMREIEQAIRHIFAGLGRFRAVRLQSIGEAHDPVYQEGESIDYIAHFILNKAYKTYHNKVIHYEDLGLFDDGRPSEDRSYEVISLPAIVGQLEVKLVDLHRDKIFWSDLRDSSAVIPYDEQLFLYNTWKYPGASHPGLTRAFLADLLRLQMADSATERALNVAERWFVSKPSSDLAVARGLLQGLANNLAPDLDANLPLEGRIATLLPEQKGKPHVRLNIGARHGLTKRMRFDVWRPRPSQQKVGQIEVIDVDSTTAIARLRKLDKKLKKRGDGLQVQDRVISPKRPSRRSL